MLKSLQKLEKQLETPQPQPVKRKTPTNLPFILARFGPGCIVSYLSDVDPEAVVGYTVINFKDEEFSINDLLQMHGELVNVILNHKTFNYIEFFSNMYGDTADGVIDMYHTCRPKDIRKFMCMVDDLAIGVRRV
jgi:hypothetical protein